MLGAGCSSQTSGSRTPVVDVSPGQTGASAASSARQSRESDEDDGPFDLVKRIVGGSDADRDGIGDSDDQCPSAPEDFDAFADEDGCPDDDNDRDGILDKDDRCPNAPETMNGVMDEDGCPDAHNNGAKRAFHEGATRYAQGDYPGARRSFEEAYRLDPHDAILFNLAKCAEMQRDRKAACDYYRRWRNSPHGANSTNGVPSLDTCP